MNGFQGSSVLIVVYTVTVGCEVSSRVEEVIPGHVMAPIFAMASTSRVIISLAHGTQSYLW
jgi:hypothetical protein